MEFISEGIFEKFKYENFGFEIFKGQNWNFFQFFSMVAIKKTFFAASLMI